MEYTVLSETELLDILSAQTAMYTDFLTIGALTPEQVETKKIIDDIVFELSKRKGPEQTRV